MEKSKGACHLLDTRLSWVNARNGCAESDLPELEHLLDTTHSPVCVRANARLLSADSDLSGAWTPAGHTSLSCVCKGYESTYRDQGRNFVLPANVQMVDYVL
jgi:hypothetical protein